MPLRLNRDGTNLIGEAPANPTTGYEWTIDVDKAGACGPAGSIEVNQEYIKDTNSGMIGGGGKTKFTLKATNTAITGSKCSIGFLYA